MQNYNITKMLSRDKALSITRDVRSQFYKNPVYEIDHTVNYKKSDVSRVEGELASIETQMLRLRGKQKTLTTSDAELYQSCVVRQEMLKDKLKVAKSVSEQVNVATKYFVFKRTKNVLKNGKLVEVFKTPRELARERDGRILALYNDYKNANDSAKRIYNAEKEFFKTVYAVNSIYDRTITSTCIKHPELVDEPLQSETITTKSGITLNKDAVQSAMAKTVIEESQKYIESNKDVFHNDLVSTEGIAILVGKNNPVAVTDPQTEKRIAERLLEEHKKLLDVVDNHVLCDNVKTELKDHLIDEKVVVKLNQAQNDQQIKQILGDAAKDFVEEHNHTNDIHHNGENGVDNEVVFDDPIAQEKYKAICELSENVDEAMKDAKALVMQGVAETVTPELQTNIVKEAEAEHDLVNEVDNERVMQKKKNS
ncbi:MAG: hypothetical protein E7361_01405 [Clostridiales bacterium]|nr:hypothetical protein [Clostridiales bacterium]